MGLEARGRNVIHSSAMTDNDNGHQIGEQLKILKGQNQVKLRLRTWSLKVGKNINLQIKILQNVT